MRKNRLWKNGKELIKYNRIIFKSQQRFKTEKNNAYTKEVNKIVLSANDEKRMQLIDSAKSYLNETSTYILHKNEEIRCNNIT